MQDAKTSKPFPVFLDIETVPQLYDWEEVDERTDGIFKKKFNKDYDPAKGSWAELWKQKSAMLAENGKVICVSLGVLAENGTKLRIKTICPNVIPVLEKNGGGERLLLDDLSVVLGSVRTVAGHNIKRFDNPFLCRRFIIHGMQPPVCIDKSNVKPWEDVNEDTMQLWSFGEFNSTISLDSLANIFKLPSPKTVMDGSMVADLYYSEPPEGMLPWDHKAEVLKKIGDYCNGDIITTVNVYLKLKRLPIITPDRIEYAAATPQQQPKLEL